MLSRRGFLGVSANVTAAGLLSCRPSPATDQLRILVLGGTNFVGPAIVGQALDRGHSVTLFNRGITRPYLFPSVEKLRGDRNPSSENLESLIGNRRWDVVIDVWPERSGMVARMAELLADRADYYHFVSSIAVYRDFGRIGLTEADTVRLDEPGTYGGEKALAELALAERFGGRHGVARCHAIVGPLDDGTAYHYWVRRFAEQEDVVAPGSGIDPVQYVDVRDVAWWIVDCAENRRPGVYNLCGPSVPMELRGFLQQTRDGIGSRARLHWIDADFLRDTHGVESFTNMPFWAPLDEDAGFYQISSDKALAAGMRYRPTSETAQAAWSWYRSHFFRDVSFPAAGMGISRERELAILEDWRVHSASN